jgi:hypothetical protein
MNDYLFGCDVLGADLTPLQQMQAQQQMVQAMSDPVLTNAMKKQQYEASQARQKALDVTKNIALIMIGSAILGGTGGALLWSAHRVGGFLIGFFLVGPAVGAAGAMTYASGQGWNQP